MKLTKARKGLVIIKIDLEKAYDRLEWDFIEETMRDAGLPQSLVLVIMKMVSSGSCRLIWNGEMTDALRPSRGLKEDDPLSPYLLILFMKKLGQWIQRRVEEGRLREVKASCNGPGLNYLIFAVDLLLFSEADDEQLRCIKEGLQLFCGNSG